ncbi:MAG: hypothetical protein ACYDCI_08315 [Candidatus Limnocylindrales bacterium]
MNAAGERVSIRPTDRFPVAAILFQADAGFGYLPVDPGKSELRV